MLYGLSRLLTPNWSPQFKLDAVRNSRSVIWHAVWGHSTWLIIWTINDLVVRQLVGFLACQKCWSAVCSSWEAVKRLVVNCTACFNIIGVVFYMLRWGAELSNVDIIPTDSPLFRVKRNHPPAPTACLGFCSVIQYMLHFWCNYQRQQSLFQEYVNASLSIFS